jgi:hypothetical protein
MCHGLEYLLPHVQWDLTSGETMLHFCTSAVYSYPRIHTVCSFTQYNLSSILQIFLHMRVSTPRQL